MSFITRHSHVTHYHSHFTMFRYRKFNAVVGAYCNTPLRANVKNVAEGLI